MAEPRAPQVDASVGVSDQDPPVLIRVGTVFDGSGQRAGLRADVLVRDWLVAQIGLDLAVPAGQVLALVGRTGSGKSTLAALVSRAVEPPRGSVRLGGVDVRDLDLQQLRSAVGVVTQRTELLAASLAENVALFADVPRDAVRAAVDALGLTDWVEGLPQGLDTPLGPGGTSLSAGEEQLVAFARLLVRDVRVVVLDEATARMDPVTEQRVVRASARLLAGRTGIVTAATNRLASSTSRNRSTCFGGFGALTPLAGFDRIFASRHRGLEDSAEQPQRRRGCLSPDLPRDHPGDPPAGHEHRLVPVGTDHLDEVVTPLSRSPDARPASSLAGWWLGLTGGAQAAAVDGG